MFRDLSIYFDMRISSVSLQASLRQRDPRRTPWREVRFAYITSNSCAFIFDTPFRGKTTTIAPERWRHPHTTKTRTSYEYSEHFSSRSCQIPGLCPLCHTRRVTPIVPCSCILQRYYE